MLEIKITILDQEDIPINSSDLITNQTAFKLGNIIDINQTFVISSFSYDRNTPRVAKMELLQEKIGWKNNCKKEDGDDSKDTKQTPKTYLASYIDNVIDSAKILDMGVHNELLANKLLDYNLMIEKAIVDGLERKGFCFKERKDLENFIKENCRREYNTSLGTVVYFVNDIPFIKIDNYFDTGTPQNKDITACAYAYFTYL